MVDDEQLNDVKAITLMDKSCVEGGATALRLSQVKHIKSIKKTVKDIRVIGLIKKKYVVNKDVKFELLSKFHVHV